MTGGPDAGSSTRERLDVGFVPAECPGAEGTGATLTSSLLVERLSRYHDLTVYVASQYDADGSSLPATDRVEYVLHDDLSSLPHPTTRKVSALRKSFDDLESHDLVHSYSSAFIPVLADLTVPTLSTLNSYLPVCPKEDLRYRDERKCSGPGRLKCTGCVLDTDLDRSDPVTNLKSAYVSMGRMGLVEESIARADEVDGYRAISPHVETDYARLGFPEDRIATIPHFYERTFRRSAGRDSIGPDPVQLLYAGRLQDNKGPQVLVRALPEMVRRGYDVELRVAGTGTEEDRLRTMANDLGVANRVEWLGYVDHADLPGEYDDADVFVYPGLLDEPFGRVMLEALGCETPVLASDVGSTDYIVDECGERFDAGDVEGLVEAFERLVEDYEDYHSAIPDHLERFDPGRIEQELLELYATVADRGHVNTCGRTRTGLTVR